MTTQRSLLRAWYIVLFAATGMHAPATANAMPSDLLRSEQTAANDGFWLPVTPPSGRATHTAIYDPVRDRMLVFGGTDGSYRNEVWALSLSGSPVWTQLFTTGTPPSARFSHAAIYDPVRDRMLVFGGYDGSNRNDVWALSLSGTPVWSQLAPAGSPPTGRYSHSAIYDPVRDRMVVFGGNDGNVTNQVWALSLAGTPAWALLLPSGTAPAARMAHAAIYDPVRDRMLVFAGSNGAINLNDVKALSLGASPAWSTPPVAGGPPPARASHTAIYDAVRDRMIVFAGTGAVSLNDVWALSLSPGASWAALAPSGGPPSARTTHAAIYDPLRDRMVVFGGQSSGLFNDTWALALPGSPAWSVIISFGTPPVARDGHAAIFDPVRDRLLVFGGNDGTLHNDVWALSLSGTPAWTLLSPTGTPPSGRYKATAVYDPVRDRMLVFGGDEGMTLRNDVWALSLAGTPAWTSLTPTGTPPSIRYKHTAIYDPVRDRMVVFGGFDGAGYENDVLALSLAGTPAWVTLAPTGTPPSARFLHTAIYDPVRDRMVVFGGIDGTLRDDTWALSLAGTPAWAALAPAGTPPSARYEHTAIYDPGRDRMVVFGGYDSNYRNDAWALSLAGGGTWSALAPGATPPSARISATAVYDPPRDRMLNFGGADIIGRRNDVWALAWTPTVSVGDGAGVRRFALAAPRPNPSRGDVAMEFELEAPAHVVLEVFDAQGRRVHRVTDAWFAAGRHASTWCGDDQSGRALGNGLYFIRMRTSGFQATRRVMRIR